MYEKHHHTSIVIDFRTTDYNTTFVKVAGYDAALQREFEGEVKFVDGMPSGDLIHPKRSFLSPTCRQLVRAGLLNRYNKGEFK